MERVFSRCASFLRWWLRCSFSETTRSKRYHNIAAGYVEQKRHYLNREVRLGFRFWPAAIILKKNCTFRWDEHILHDSAIGFFFTLLCSALLGKTDEFRYGLRVRKCRPSSSTSRSFSTCVYLWMYTKNHCRWWLNNFAAYYKTYTMITLYVKKIRASTVYRCCISRWSFYNSKSYNYLA